ncbi:MAG TPA: 6-phosphogluconolactonase [Candidatus Binatia bacterium]|nr:6-phosphogluconolactonase [Candidatus Binatia bacterium]
MSGEPELRVLEDADAAARAAAETIADALGAAVRRRGRADWATTGGSTPGRVYGHLASDPLRHAVEWERVHVWWGDDRFVPRDNPLSNVLPLDQILLSMTERAGLSGSGGDAALVEIEFDPGVFIPAANVHAPRMADAIGRSETVDWVADRYEEELRAGGVEVGENGFPAFDVLFLGVGPDGHVLSAFPGSPLFDSERWVAGVPAPTHVEPHVARISLNPKVVAAARLVLPVAFGEGKAAILADVFGPERDERRWPAQLARREGATWILDRAAAARLQR